MINVEEYFKSVALEFDALKNRIRSFIGGSHWPTDGEFKETVLRSVLRRHLPSTVGVGRGFVVTKDGCSRQIDVLIFDETVPMLYRDGDLVFVPREGVLGIIEVKSNTTTQILEDALTSLSENSKLIKENSRREIFTGLFSYDTDLRESSSATILNKLHDAADGDTDKIINHISLGSSLFSKYWPHEPHPTRTNLSYNKWHLYKLPRKSQGYFIHNIVATVASHYVSNNELLWFPESGKESGRIGTKDFE